MEGTMPTQHHAHNHTQHHTTYQTEHYTRTKAKKVLVIEDDKVSLLMMTLIIRGAGYRVVGAPDVAQALKAIRLERPDLILADINLTSEASGSEWDGFQVLEWM